MATATRPQTQASSFLGSDAESPRAQPVPARAQPAVLKHTVSQLAAKRTLIHPAAQPPRSNPHLTMRRQQM
eukprot:6188786-Pleurochrysis_carterae.AAC.1